MKTIRAAAAICAVSEIAGLFLLIGCQGGSSGMSAMQDAPASVRFPALARLLQQLSLRRSATGRLPQGPRVRAWLGIVPRQYSTGGKAKLLGISKRGNACLRKILIHGARAAMLRIKRDRAPIGAWLGSHGQQARTDRMGCVVEWKRIAPDSERICRMK